MLLFLILFIFAAFILASIFRNGSPSDLDREYTAEDWMADCEDENKY